MSVEGVEMGSMTIISFSLACKHQNLCLVVGKNKMCVRYVFLWIRVPAGRCSIKNASAVYVRMCMLCMYDEYYSVMSG